MTELNENTKKEYVAPQMEVVEMEVQRTLCGSGVAEIEDDYDQSRILTMDSITIHKKKYVSPEIKTHELASKHPLLVDSFNNGYINMKDETKSYLA